jgi:hypothetical protein
MMGKRKSKNQDEAKAPVLTDMQRLFVVEYASCLNARRAAIRAGYSEKTAQEQGSRLLSIVKVREAIDQLLSDRIMSAMEVLERFGQQARGDHSQFYEDDFNGGIYVNLKKLCDAGLGHLIKSITRDGVTKRITKVEFYDSQAAMRDLGKYHKLFTERTDITNSDGSMRPTTYQFIPYVPTGADTDNS